MRCLLKASGFRADFFFSTALQFCISICLFPKSIFKCVMMFSLSDLGKVSHPFLLIMLLGLKMAGKSNRGKNRGRASNVATNLSVPSNSADSSAASKDNSIVVESSAADENGVQQSNLGDRPSRTDEATPAKSEGTTTTTTTTSSDQPKPGEGNLTISIYDLIICMEFGFLASHFK